MGTRHYSVQVTAQIYLAYDIDDDDEREEWQVEQQALDLADAELMGSSLGYMEGYQNYELTESHVELESEDEDEAEEHGVYRYWYKADGDMDYEHVGEVEVTGDPADAGVQSFEYEGKWYDLEWDGDDYIFEVEAPAVEPLPVWGQT